MLTYIFIYLIVALAGYLIGRWGHCYLMVWLKNPGWVLHHWIYGFILMVIGLIFHRTFTGLLVFSFGTGHFISDFKDFLQLRIFGPDADSKKRFWEFD